MSLAIDRCVLRTFPLVVLWLFLLAAVVPVATSGCGAVRGEAGRNDSPPSLRRQALLERDRLELEAEAPLNRNSAPPELSEEFLPEETLQTAALPAPGQASEEQFGSGTAQTAHAAEPASEQQEGESLLPLIAKAANPQQAGALRCVEQGKSLLAKGERERAREWFERALSLDPNNPYAYYYLARHALLDRRPDQAQAFASRAQALAAALSPRWRAQLEVLQGEIWESVGRFADARRAYHQATEWDPQNPTAQAGLARLAAP